MVGRIGRGPAQQRHEARGGAEMLPRIGQALAAIRPQCGGECLHQRHGLVRRAVVAPDQPPLRMGLRQQAVQLGGEEARAVEG